MSAKTMTCFKPQIYNLDFFLKTKEEGFSYTIDDDVLAIINSLANEVGAPSYIKTPQFSKKNFHKRRKRRPQEINDEDWEAIRNFQVTERIEKEGLEKLLSNLKGALNKITDKNYEGQKNVVISTLEEINKNASFTDEENFDVCKTIFDIASTNKFYSAVYAMLFKDIINKFETMKTIFNDRFDTFLALFQEIEACDPNKDYNQFCIVTKKNENRRALSMFFINLMKEELVPPNDVIKIILHLQEKLKEMIKEEDSKSQVDEISENLFIFITNTNKELESHDDWKSIVDYVEEISNTSIKSVKSLTNKSVFRHLDILDEIN